VPTFSQIEVSKYQKYANFGIDVEVVTGNESPDYFRPSVGTGERLKNASPNASPNSQIAKYQPPPKGGYGVKTNIFRGVSPKGKLLLAAGAGALAAGTGIGGAMFLRRRRTKKGKIVVEQVRRKV